MTTADSESAGFKFRAGPHSCRAGDQAHVSAPSGLAAVRLCRAAPPAECSGRLGRLGRPGSGPAPPGRPRLAPGAAVTFAGPDRAAALGFIPGARCGHRATRPPCTWRARVPHERARPARGFGSGSGARRSTLPAGSAPKQQRAALTPDRRRPRGSRRAARPPGTAPGLRPRGRGGRRCPRYPSPPLGRRGRFCPSRRRRGGGRWRPG